MGWGKDWLGGRVWIDDRGKKTFHIRKRVNGRRYEYSTRCHTERAALEQLAMFEKDPDGYRPGNVVDKRLVLDQDLLDRFIAFSEKTKKNSPRWVAQQKVLGKWWSEQLGKRDLRKVTLRDDITPALSGVTRWAKRIAVIKAVYAWLRKELHVLTSAEDPTLDLAVPQASPAQWKKSKVIPREVEKKVLALLSEQWADLSRLLSATGCHLSEAVAFAERGTVEVSRDQHVLVLPHTKGGGVHRLAISTETAEVAKRILERGSFGDSAYAYAFSAACKKLGVSYGPGNFRHTFATRMREAGATDEAVASYLHHKSTATTRKFYATLGVVPLPEGTTAANEPEQPVAEVEQAKVTPLPVLSHLVPTLLPSV